MDYKYYAFISYSRKDEKYAKWIQEKLESYKVPSKIAHENPNLRKGIRPIFRDKTDLGAGVLDKNLEKEVAASQHLIVVSSPASAKSEWVEKETRDFLKTHNPDHIIPLIVAGTPNSNDENECFNPAIKEIKPEVLGVNIQEIGKQKALTKVVAKLLDLDFDNLWQRHKRKEKRKKITLALCAILLLLAGLYAGDYNRPKYEYYAGIAEYADGWLPKGVVKLTKEQVEHRFNTYRFVYKQRKLQEVALVNSKGNAIGNIMLFVHPDRKGSKPVIQHLNKSKDILFMEEFSGDNYNRIDFMFPPEKGGSAFGIKTFTNIATEIRRHAITRNEAGFVIRKEFKRYPGVDAVDASDDNGIYGYEYEVDDIGQILALYYLDQTKSRVALKNGMASIRYTYDAMGNVVKEQYLDMKGNPYFTYYGGSETRRTFDQFGNNIEESYFDETGEKCIAPFYGYATFRTKYDDQGNKIKQAYYDERDSLCMSLDNVALLTQKFDNEGNIIEIACFNADREPCCNAQQRVAKTTLKYDKHNNIIEEAYFGVDGNPSLCNLGFAKYTQKYDERGNVIEGAYFGVDGKPCLNNFGFAKHTQKYDERGNVIEEAYFGVDGKPCLHNSGFAKYTQKYDERGNIIEGAYFGTDDKPCLCDLGYAKYTIKYDEHGNVTERAYFGVDGEPMSLK